jgi:hypothetical protein
MGDVFFGLFSSPAAPGGWVTIPRRLRRPVDNDSEFFWDPDDKNKATGHVSAAILRALFIPYNTLRVCNAPASFSHTRKKSSKIFRGNLR